MKKTILFIHGYGSDRNSRKFQNLKDYFVGEYKCHCLEWVVYSDIPYVLELAVEKCAGIENLIIIGDSTGANFAWQIREMRSRKTDILVLLSPLLDVSKRKNDMEFPVSFNQYLKKIDQPENALIIASKNDEVINMKSLFEKPNNKFKLLEVNDNHRLKNFKMYLPALKAYINKKDKNKTSSNTL